ncbi:MAG: hypothetical protein QOD06_3130, partial [Candidatus Binatota bacterium]|nr:hypothetical protein [Candidatus Binatota bacterium]
MAMHPILDRRLLFVSGKGGVGKTVTAATVALFAFRKRRRVLVVELSAYGRMRDLLGGPEPGAEPVEVMPRLEILRVDPRRALEEFLDGLLRFRALRRRLLASSSFSILTAAAPGIEEFLVLSKIAALERAKLGVRRRPRYDLIVVDAPATGHSLPLLSTARTLAEMVAMGPIAETAGEVATLLADPRRSAALIVTLAEEMAVNETIEIVAGLGESRSIAIGGVIVNAMWPDRFDVEERRWLSERSDDGAEPLIALGRYHVERRRRAEQQLERLRLALDVDPIVLPLLVGPALDR